MTKNTTRWLPALLLALLALAACGKDDGNAAVSGGDTSAPEAAVKTTLKQLKAGDFKALAHSALPPADYARLDAEWSKKLAEADEITDEDRQKFTEQMQQFTAPDCADKLFQQAEPVLGEFETKYKAQLPMYVGMGQTMAATGIDQSETLNAAQKQQAKDTLAVMAQWVQSTNWGDKDKARQAIGIVCDTARNIDLKTLDQARSLKFDEVLDKYGQVWGGARKVFALYDLDFNAIIDSAQVKTVSNDGSHAVVSTTVTMFDKPITSESKLVQIDGHWYNEDLVKNLEKEMADQDATASSADAGDED